MFIHPIDKKPSANPLSGATLKGPLQPSEDFSISSLQKTKLASRQALQQQKPYSPFAFEGKLPLAKENKKTNEGMKILRCLLTQPIFKTFLQSQILVRIAFEKILEAIKLDSSQAEPPFCFISYAWGLNPETEEWIKSPPAWIKAIQEWLKTKLLPDLDRAGVRALFDLREIGPENDIGEYRESCASSSYVLLVCTEAMKRRYEQEKGEEIILLNKRYDDIQLQKTIFPLLYQGDWEKANPLPMLAEIVDYCDFRKIEDYYVSCLKLCGALRGVSMQDYLERFEQARRKIWQKEEITAEDERFLQRWSEEQKTLETSQWTPLLLSKH